MPNILMGYIILHQKPDRDENTNASTGVIYA